MHLLGLLDDYVDKVIAAAVRSASCVSRSEPVELDAEGFRRYSTSEGLVVGAGTLL